MPDSPPKETRAERRRAQMVGFAGALLSYPTVVEAAAATGISSRTATRWLHSQEFKDVYVASRAATLASIAGLLRASAVGAVEALAAVIRDPKAPATAKTNAARSILGSMLNVIESQEVDARLSKLEALAEAQKDRK